MKRIILAGLLIFSGCSSYVIKDEPKKADANAATQPMSPPAPANADEIGSKVSCARDSDVRYLVVVKKEKGCALEYNKAGKDHTAASAMVGTSHCMQSKKKIIAHLESAGFNCK